MTLMTSKISSSKEVTSPKPTGELRLNFDPCSLTRDTHVAIHATSFEDLLLKEELLRAIGECGFEHPSEGLFFLA